MPTGDMDNRQAVKDISEITPEWLTHILHSSILKDSEAVTASSWAEIGEGQAFASSIYRINVEYRQENDLPRSFILKLPIQHEKTKKAILGAGSYYKEARFYGEIAPEIEVGIPKVYYVATDESDECFNILMEDLGDIERASFLEAIDIADCRAAIRDIADFHVEWWNHPILEFPWLQSPVDNLENVPLLVDMLRRSLEIAPNIDVESAYLVKCMQHYANAMENPPKNVSLKKPVTLIHGDFHAGNMTFGGGSMTLFDWQNIGKGSPVTDVAYLLVTSLDAATFREHEDSLLRLYHESLVEQGIADYSYRRMMTDYNTAILTCVVTLFSLLGTLDFDVPDGQETIETMMDRLNRKAMARRLLPVCRLLPVIFWFMNFFGRFRR